MEKSGAEVFGSSFERVFVALLSLATGGVLIYLALMGPLFFNVISYKTAPVIYNQLLGQDLINLFVLSVISIAGGIALLMKKLFSRYLLLSTPLYLIYYALSYSIGWEWSSSQYSGNSERYMFLFIFILSASLIIMLYSLSMFKEKPKNKFNRKGLAVYTVLFSFFMLVFASMWAQEVVQVALTGTARAYDIAPTAFWLVRVFDLGFTVPLGLISLYLLWARPDPTYPLQVMFYGFFLTMIAAVNAMGIVMLAKNDPTFLIRDLVVFMTIGAIVYCGAVFVFRNYGS